jgi:hypothetical protein
MKIGVNITQMKPRNEFGEPSIPTGNGKGKIKLLSRRHLDNRTSGVRRMNKLIRSITQDFGGLNALSTMEVELIEAFASCAATLRDLSTRRMLGAEIDLAEHGQCISNMVRCARLLGLARRPRDMTPTLDEYLGMRSNAANAEPNAEVVDAD